MLTSIFDPVDTTILPANIRKRFALLAPLAATLVLTCLSGGVVLAILRDLVPALEAEINLPLMAWTARDAAKILLDTPLSLFGAAGGFSLFCALTARHAWHLLREIAGSSSRPASDKAFRNTPTAELEQDKKWRRYEDILAAQVTLIMLAVFAVVTTMAVGMVIASRIDHGQPIDQIALAFVVVAWVVAIGGGLWSTIGDLRRWAVPRVSGGG